MDSAVQHREVSPAVNGKSKEQLSPPSQPSKKRHWGRWLILVLAIAGIAYWLRGGGPLEVSVDTAAVRDLSGSFTAEAVVKSKEYQLGPEVPGRVDGLFVREGQNVSAGQILLRTSAVDADEAVREAVAAQRSAAALVAEASARYSAAERELRARIRSARARVTEAVASLNRVKSGARREEISQAEHRVERAKVAQLDAQRSYDRARFLFEQGASARASFETAEARLRAAEAEVKEAQDVLDLLNAGARSEDVQIAQRSVDSARADLNLALAGDGQLAAYRQAIASATAAMDQAAASVSRARAAAKRCDLRSPVSGTVTKVAIEPGAVIGAGHPSIVISTRQDFRIEGEISSEDAGKVSPGMPVTVTSPAYPGRQFPARIQSILPVGELKPDAAIRTRIIRTRIQLDRDADLFRPGMELDVEGTAVLKKALCVPSDAIHVAEDRSVVFVVAGGKVTEKEVRLGYTGPDFTEITAGLGGGEQIVTSGKEGLTNNTEVKVRR